MTRVKAFPDLPVAPLYEALVREMHRVYEGDAEAVCAAAGIPSRQFRAWKSGEYEHVAFRVADRVLATLEWQWWMVWPWGTPAGDLAEAAFWTGDFSQFQESAA